MELDQKEKQTIIVGLEFVIRDTKRAQTRCMELRENAHKFGGKIHGGTSEHWKAQWEAYQRGIDRATHLIEKIKEN